MPFFDLIEWPMMLLVHFFESYGKVCDSELVKSKEGGGRSQILIEFLDVKLNYERGG